MNRILKLLKLRNIDVCIYRMQRPTMFYYDDFPYSIRKFKQSNKKTRYFITDGSTLIHESYLYKKVFLMRLLHKKGPVIGNCSTHKDFRGQSIYPYVINHIANEFFKSKKKDIYIIVNSNNYSSIKGIEKAGFNKYALIKANRFLFFYLNKDVIILNS